MNKPIIRILIWLGIMAVLTSLAMVIWTVLFHGSQSTESLKWLQLVQTLGTFALPPILCAWIWSADHKPFTWLGMDRGITRQTALLAIATMVCAIPSINLLADLNGRIHLPACLDSIEKILRSYEDAAAQLTERFLQADNIGTMVFNIILLALLPAMAEELTFRGTLQQIMANGPKSEKAKVHVAIWVAAIVFSAIHMQFYGFLPRMLLGAMFGYAFVWTGSLWAPILMHFTNNAVAVICYYIFGETGRNKDSLADTIGAGNTWWLGVLSLIVVCVLLGLLERSRTNE
ncbi:MAG: CPBP family intramembrane metalloprotease [Paludibacteraceae bacterium]|nr:CPBP family intramembrane metalloprotease [Paludibacteraceae bacterium]